ncbi:MAG: hypothetical protein GF416_02390 [Candidatus Altiarchaeales archaeon]|nr:hypothetical protein [Candidatus Altiarchaeales archaeon]MBD3415968.1 hypothetical protein [Candidatus Altiarchaeales archaeon]
MPTFKGFGEYYTMGDYDGEIYRSMNDIYGEVNNMRMTIQTLNETMKEVAMEIKALRDDLKQQRNSPI